MEIFKEENPDILEMGVIESLEPEQVTVHPPTLVRRIAEKIAAPSLFLGGLGYGVYNVVGNNLDPALWGWLAALAGGIMLYASRSEKLKSNQ